MMYNSATHTHRKGIHEKKGEIHEERRDNYRTKISFTFKRIEEEWLNS